DRRFGQALADGLCDVARGGPRPDFFGRAIRQLKRDHRHTWEMRSCFAHDHSESMPESMRSSTKSMVPCPMADWPRTRFCEHAYSPTYGMRAMKRARLIASFTARWKAAQLPLRLRLKSFPWLVQSFLSVCTSL